MDGSYGLRGSLLVLALAGALPFSGCAGRSSAPLTTTPEPPPTDAWHRPSRIGSIEQAVRLDGPKAPKPVTGKDGSVCLDECGEIQESDLAEPEEAGRTLPGTSVRLTHGL